MRSRVAIVFILAAIAGIGRADPPPTTLPSAGPIPDAASVGGEPRGIVRVGLLTYAGTMTAKCFSDHFLQQAAQDTTITTSGKLHAVNLGTDAVFEYPLLVMSGEGRFELTEPERVNLRRYIENGGTLLASAGCSSPEWDRSFRAELSRVLPDRGLKEIAMNHPLFHVAYDIAELHTKEGTPAPLQGITIDGRLGVIYSFDGLNDTAHTVGCCCCGGNEITNGEQVNVNILAYALTH